MEKLESSRLLASKDTEKFRKDSPWWYWGVEVLGGAILGGLGGFIGWKFIPLNASSYKQFIYPTVGSILGFVFGIFVIYYLIFLYF